MGEKQYTYEFHPKFEHFNQSLEKMTTGPSQQQRRFLRVLEAIST